MPQESPPPLDVTQFVRVCRACRRLFGTLSPRARVCRACLERAPAAVGSL